MVERPFINAAAIIKRFPGYIIQMTRIQPDWKQDPENEEDIVLLLATAVIFTLALASVLAFYS